MKVKNALEDELTLIEEIQEMNLPSGICQGTATCKLEAIVRTHVGEALIEVDLCYHHYKMFDKNARLALFSNRSHDALCGCERPYNEVCACCGAGDITDEDFDNYELVDSDEKLSLLNDLRREEA